MSLDTYNALKNEIIDYLDRDDLTSNVDTFIDLAEARHKREIRTRDMIERDTITVDARYEELPSGFLQMKTLRLLTDPVTVLTELNQHEMNRQRNESTGKPEFYTVHENIEFDVTPDSSYSGEIIYWKAFTALSDSNTTNKLLTNAPDVYLYGALSASAPFLMNDERIQVWETLYRDARDSLLHNERRSGRAGPLVSRVWGATP